MRFVLTVMMVLFLTGNAEAFHQVMTFSESANSGGGAGNFFSGSPRSKGYQCHVCHVAAEQKISIGFSSGLSSGTYRAGLVYTIKLTLEGEHRGLESAFNANTFTAEMTDAEGTPVGRFTASGIGLEKDFTVAIGEGFGTGENEWEFSWLAPEIAVPATLYIAMVDGDGVSDPETRLIDPLNDDVATMALLLCPDGEVCTPPDEPEEERSPAGCATGGSNNGMAMLGFLLLVFVAIRPRNEERSAK